MINVGNRLDYGIFQKHLFFFPKSSFESFLFYDKHNWWDLARSDLHLSFDACAAKKEINCDAPGRTGDLEVSEVYTYVQRQLYILFLR